MSMFWKPAKKKPPRYAVEYTKKKNFKALIIACMIIIILS